jgi:hypothetical protein
LNGQISDDFGSTTNHSPGAPPEDITQWRLYNVSASSTEWTARMDGATFYTQGANTVGFTSSPLIGRGFDGYYWQGDMAEILVYDHVLTPEERETVGFYLNNKYAFTSPTTFDNFRDGNYDGLPDAVDRQLGYDPTSMDVDNDGDTNLQNILAGLDPLDPLSVLPPPLQPIPGNPPPTITLTEPADAVPLP